MAVRSKVLPFLLLIQFGESAITEAELKLISEIGYCVAVKRYGGYAIEEFINNPSNIENIFKAASVPMRNAQIQSSVQNRGKLMAELKILELVGTQIDTNGKSVPASYDIDRIKKLQRELENLKEGGAARQNQLMRRGVASQLLTAGSISGGLSFVLNINTLLKGEWLQFLCKVGKDTGLAVATTGLGIGMKQWTGLLDDLAGPLASLTIATTVGLVTAAVTGDWVRFWKDLAVSGGGIAGGALGSMGGTALCACVSLTGWGAILVPAVLGLVGALGGSLATRQIPGVHGPTPKELNQAIASKLDPELRQTFSAYLDQGQDIMQMFKEGKLPLVFSDEVARILHETMDASSNALSRHLSSGAAGNTVEMRIAFLQGVKLEVCADL